MTDAVKVQVGEYGSESFFKQALDLKQSELLQSDQIITNGESQIREMTMRTYRNAQDLLIKGRVREANDALRPALNIWPDLDMKNDDAARLQTQIAEKLGPTTAPAPIDTQFLVELTPELAAATDSTMSENLRNLAEAQRRLNFAQAQYAPSTEVVRNAKADVEGWQREVDARLEKLKSAIPTTTAPAGSSNPLANTDPNRLTLTEANDRLKTMKDRRLKLSDDIKKLQIRESDVATISSNLQESQKELDTVHTSRSQLEFEGVSGGRTVVISPGDKPIRPDKDRRIPAAVGGGLGGLALGLGIFAVLGFFDRRVRSIADAKESLDGSKRILGILPALPLNITDPEQVSAVAFAVHHIRTLLQLGSREKRSSTFTITSAGPQDGKTSLTMALGMSYAASGAKTLLIDTDVVGAGLSYRMGAVVRPRLGSLLVGKGLLTSEQLEAALAESKQTGNRIGRVLVNLGFIKPAEKQQALTEQSAGNLGFLDMLDGRELADCIMSTGSPNLSVMPVGNIEVNHKGRVSIDTIHRIIADARKKFDIVLFDTGPLLGSLEAGIVAAAAEEVIVAVARGQQIQLLDQTFRRLRELEAQVAGIVFNRAHVKDIERSGYASSVASQRIESPVVSRVNGSSTPDGARSRGLGPIAEALSTSSKNEDSR
jgi:Mrp family chromosome partitioning ATPase